RHTRCYRDWSSDVCSSDLFWSGLLLILLFSLTLGWLPITASGGFRALLLPAVTLAAPAAAVLARITRASVLEVLRHEYVRTARRSEERRVGKEGDARLAGC